MERQRNVSAGPRLAQMAGLILALSQATACIDKWGNGNDTEDTSVVETGDTAVACDPTTVPFGATQCNDGVDNDSDSPDGIENIDGRDSDCENACDETEGTVVEPTECSDHADNDEDGWVDGYDSGCISGNSEGSYDGEHCDTPVHGSTACFNGLDEDTDGLVDSEDPDCESACDTIEGTPKECNDGIDNDGNGYTDMEDGDCESLEDDCESEAGFQENGCNN